MIPTDDSTETYILFMRHLSLLDFLMKSLIFYEIKLKIQSHND